MPLTDRMIRLASGRHLPRRTLRLRLTLLYGGLFLLSGAVLLAITYLLVVNATSGFVFTTQTDHGHGRATIVTGVHDGHPLFAQGDTNPGRGAHPGSAHTQSVTQLQAQAEQQHNSELHELLRGSGIALAGMSLASILLGWIVAGRALRPLRTITAATCEISASNLHRRLALQGPNDEVKDLGDTIDALLARLEDSFHAQRAFVANASHELRTPLTLSRAMLQFALADPALTFDSLKATCADALSASAEHEQLLDALLTLAQSQQQIEQHETFDLAPIVKDVIEGRRQQAATHAVALDTALEAAPVCGDRRLTRQLVSNLLDNALLHNHPGGEARVTIEARARRTTLTVENTGPRVPPDQIERLLQPFRRLTTDRTSDTPGHGLGLSIVAAIAAAHDATLGIRPNQSGGLHVDVSFPRREARPPARGHGQEPGLSSRGRPRKLQRRVPL
ncbi:MAG TPA: HAMP domain-containing sensor histidine kinase [Solirubrobacteraceae bacterium]|nr:HAMP domain-containing sensor histidine kinase [Solirubrobacteraceae bacterium]